MPDILVTDANILIDLAQIDQHEVLFLPAYEIGTTVDVFYELNVSERTSWQPYVASDRLQLEDIPLELIEGIRSAVPPGLSDPDCTAIILAEQREAMLLSGDQLLVKAYRERGKAAHGMLWLLDENERIGRYDQRALHDVLTSIMRVNLWMPRQLCAERLTKWKSSF